jgi:hypothetical protein
VNRVFWVNLTFSFAIVTGKESITVDLVDPNTKKNIGTVDVLVSTLGN